MKKLTLLAAGLAALMPRHATRDVAFPYRMGAGNAGDINRTHPFQSLAGIQDATSPLTRYGNAALIATGGGMRTPIAGDTAITKIYGVLARPYPIQGFSWANQGLGTPAPPAPADKQILDICTQGFILVNVFGAPVTKGGAVFVWVAASGGGHIQGGFEAAATGGSTAAIVNAVFNGPQDANGVAEIEIFRQ